MEAVSTRVASFKKSKRVKNPEKPSSTTTLKWPHPSDFQANPETLAEAGFFYDPSYDDPDNVTCFICDKQLGGWEENDDPFLIHWNKCGQTCCWASVRCGLLMDVDHSGRFISADKTRLPAHKSMERARLETFSAGKGWIHDKAKGHGANSKTMASAGFVYTPQHSGDDLATCLYCNTSLSGWDEGDDPLEEHKKRANKSGYDCPFFAASPELGTSTKPPSKAQSTKPPSKSQSRPPSRSTSRTKHQDSILPTKTFDGEGEDDSDPSEVPNPGRSTAKTPRKPRATTTSRKSSAKTPRNKTRSSSRSGLKNVAEEDEDEEDPVDPPPTVKKKARSRSKSVARSEVVDNTEVEEEIMETRKPSRSRSKKPAADSEAEVEEEVVRKSSRSKSKASVAVSVTEDEAPRKPSRTRTKAKVTESEQEDLPLVTPKPKQKRAASRPKSKAPVEPLVVDSEPEPEVLTIAPKPKQKRTVSRSKSRAPVEPSDVDSEPEPEPEVVSVVPKQKHKRTASRAKSKAPMEASEIESEPEAEVLTAAPKPKHKRAVSRSKCKAPVEPSEVDSEPEAEVLTVAPKAKPKRAVSKSKIKAPVEPSEIDPEREEEAPPKKAASKTKTKIPPVEDLFNDDVAMDDYVPPPSSPPAVPSHASTTELPPLFVPKRNTKPPAQQRPAAEESIPVEKEKKKPGRPKTKPQPASRPQSAKTDDNEQSSITSVSTDTSGPLNPISINPPQPPAKENKPMSKAKPTASHHPEMQVTKMKVVEISSDEEENVILESDRDMKTKAAPLRGKENTQTSSAKATPHHDVRPTSAQDKHEKKPTAIEAVQPQAVKPPPRQASERPVTPAPPPPPAPLADDDVNMDVAEDDAHPVIDDNVAYEPPRTPVRSKGRVSPPKEIRIEKEATEPPFVPALSKLPFIPITTLSEAELDMTVEDWIRYQMDAEFDKLRRDGERELQRFRKKAEDTRKIIESL
ncbi:hypothetical protein M413DRAFT_442427 [Hebeloma cylindrosporum]|uniref:BIR-domain-containing protein n=1 Tax=Hebeloma cylindrosporum TaxID=76867 RepID=A0A0C3C6D1_HEBCY|nr:hypothetical protein M413DRAFT_442427 [Hebeloma cylindrosporum h7]